MALSAARVVMARILVQIKRVRTNPDLGLANPPEIRNPLPWKGFGGVLKGFLGRFVGMFWEFGGRFLGFWMCF